MTFLLASERVKYAIPRDYVLPFSTFFRKLSKRKMAVNTAWLVYFISVAPTCTPIGLIVAFFEITEISTITKKPSYLFPIIVRYPAGRKAFVPAKWNLSRFLPPLAAIAS